MANHRSFRNGWDHGSSLFTHSAVLDRDLETTDRLDPDRLIDIAGSVNITPQPATMNGAAQHAESDSVSASTRREEPATEMADETLTPARAITVPAAAQDEEPNTAEANEVGAARLDQVAGMLALAQKLHDQYVFEGQDTRERLISEGQARHDQVVGEATARHDVLLATGQAKYDEFMSVGQARHHALMTEAEALLAKATLEHEDMITEGRRRSEEMISEAQQEKAEVLEGLRKERAKWLKEIEELRTFERDHRARLKYYLEGQLTELEQAATAELELGLTATAEAA